MPNSRIFFTEDTTFGQTKLGELPGWFMRRSKNPVDWGRACSRVWWRWQMNYMLPKKAGLAGPMQFFAGAILLSYVINYNKTFSHHKNFKLHW